MLDPDTEREVTDTVLELLRTAADAAVPPAARRVGDHDGPDDRTRPYSVLRIVDGGATDGSWGDPHEMPEVVVQVSSVGDSRDQAQLHKGWMAQLILGRDGNGYLHAIQGATWRVWKREVDVAGGVDGGGVDAPLFNAVDRFRLSLTRR